jgi:hypothetical protein
MSTPFLKRVRSDLALSLGVLIAVASTAFWLWLAKWPLGVAGEWTIKPNTGPWPPGAWGLPLATLGIFGGFAALSAYDRFKRAKNQRERAASTRLCLLGIALLTFLWPWSLLGPGGTSNLVASQWSDIANEYFSTAYQIEDARDFSQAFAATRQNPDAVAQAHVATHPPGAVLFYYGARRIYEAVPFLQKAFSSAAASLTSESVAGLAVRSNELRRSAARSAGIPDVPPNLPVAAVGGAVWSAFLISLLLALAVPAIYLIAASQSISTHDDEQSRQSAEIRGLIAAALWALAPAVSLFAFTLDGVIASGAAWTLAFLALSRRDGRAFWMIAAGAMLALSSYISFGVLAAGVTVVIAVLALRRKEPWALVRDVVLFLLGFFVVWLAIVATLPMSPVAVFSQAMEAHRFATVNARSRPAWTVLNLLSFAVFCGWPVIAAALCAAWRNWREARDRRKLAKEAELVEANWKIPLAIGMANLAVIVLLDLSGKALGEVERLWMFLLPPLCVLAALQLARTNIKTVAALLALLAFQTLLMAAWLAPLVLPL